MRIILAFLVVLSFPLFGTAQWTQCNGPYGGYMDFIAQNTSTQTLFAGSTTAGLYRYNSGLSKWESLLNQFPTPQISGLICFDSVVYVCDYFGLYKSVNDGNTWDTVVVTNHPSTQFGFLRSDGHSIMISVNNDSVYISHNGSTFTPFSFAYYDVDLTVVSTRLIRSSFITNTHSGGSTIYLGYSDNLGQSWQTVFIDSVTYQYTSLSSISIQPYLNDFYVFINGQARYVTSDSGSSWAPIICQNLPFCGQQVNQLLQSSTGLWIAGQSGVSVYSNGVLQITNNGLTAFPVSAVCNYINNLFVCLNDSILFSSPDGGSTWNPINLQGIPTYYPINIQGMINIGNRIILTTQFLGTAYSDNGGVYWIDSLDNGNLYEPIVAGKKIYANPDERIEASDDSGLNWYLASSGVSVNNLSCGIQNIAANGESVVAVEFCSNGSIIGNVSQYALIYSTDTGATFQASNFPTDQYFSNIAVLGSNAFAIGSAFLKSDDKGADWYIDSTYNQNTYAAIYTIEPNFVLLGTKTGHILLSSDTGKTFTDITANFTAIPTMFYNLGSNLYVISSEQGIWKTDATQYGIPNSIIDIPLLNVGFHVYPNPAHDILHIVLSHFANSNAPVIIKIYNVMGKEVFNEITTASPTFTISTGNFLKGVYMLKLTGSDVNEAAKFIIN